MMRAISFHQKTYVKFNNKRMEKGKTNTKIFIKAESTNFMLTKQNQQRKNSRNNNKEKKERKDYQTQNGTNRKRST